MDISVVVRAREDETGPEGILEIASVADRLGYPELWIGEGPTWDAFVLATALGSVTQHAAMTVGPVPVSVRDPATISRGAASVAAVTGRRVGVALGTASVRVVEKLHGRSRRRAVTDLRASARALRKQIDGSASLTSEDPDAAFLRRLGAPNGPLTVAAFGDRAIQVAAEYADRMLLDLVTTEQVAELRSKLDQAVGTGPGPTLAAWLPAAIDPSLEALDEIGRTVAGYLTVAGYREMFLEAGFEKAVEAAGSGGGVDAVPNLLPDEGPALVGLVGDVGDVASRIDEYARAGLDEIAIVPVTAGDPGGERTLRAVRELSP
jgi:probable F420-dependent oxidoreductase